MPRIEQIVNELLEEWRDHRADNPDADPDEWVSQNSADAVPAMTTTLFQMVVDDNSLAWIDGPEDVSEPFACLSGAIRQEVEQRTLAAIKDEQDNEREEDD